MSRRQAHLFLAATMTTIAAIGALALPTTASATTGSATTALAEVTGPPATISAPATIPSASTPAVTRSSPVPSSPSESPHRPPSPTPCSYPATLAPTTGTAGPTATRPPATTSIPTSCPGATITGQLLDGTAPASGVLVYLLNVSNLTLRTLATTDATGTYVLKNVPPGSYKIEFAFPPYALVQFYPGTRDAAAATVITTTGFETITVSDQVLPHASVRGTVTTYTGAAAANVWVQIFSATGGRIGEDTTDAAGVYSFDYLPEGTYRVAFSASRFEGAPVQWAPRQRAEADAELITVPVGVATTVDEQLLPLGEISGSFTGANPGIMVEARSTTDAAQVVRVWTNADDNSFHLLVYPGTYRIKFDADLSGLDQWAYGAVTEADATVITVTAGGHVVVNDTSVPHGTLSGTLFDVSGAAVVGATVVLTNVSNGQSFQQTTLGNGNWAAAVPVGTYVVKYTYGEQTQWSHGQTSVTRAARYTVTSGGSVELPLEVLAAVSHLRVTATDAVTGARIRSFCADANGPTYADNCTENGVVDLNVAAGSYTVRVNDSVHLVATKEDVQVMSGATVNLPFVLKRAGVLRVSFVDAATGAPVSAGCVAAMPADRPLDFGEASSDCADASGSVTIPQVIPDRYNLLAIAQDDVHGAQWVGASGGVGSQAAAKDYTVAAGATTKVTIRLDGKGSVSGVVTDRATGEPVSGANVYWADGLGGYTDGDGRYTIDGLGPYQWSLQFLGGDHAGQWSGGVADRRRATPVAVRVGQTTAYDFAMRQGTLVTGTVSAPAGHVVNWSRVLVYNADTNDVMSIVPTGADGTYRTWALSPQKVKLVADGSVDSIYTHQWYLNAADYAHARALTVPPSGSLTANLTLAP